MKESQTRLLDLLAGWCQFLHEEAEVDPDSDSATIDKIHDLYQKAGVPEDMTDQEVTDFVVTHVVPILLSG